jgi:5-methylcytosine-specific restriction endonuclease McrA
MEAPSIVRLRRYVRIPYRQHAPLTRRAVFARDDWSCQYCGAAAENLDHVVPRSRGGTHTWDNVVASCRRCNARKENRTPVEAGFRLLRPPFAPTDGFRLTLGHVDPGWEPYLTI